MARTEMPDAIPANDPKLEWAIKAAVNARDRSTKSRPIIENI
jgi:hypothetical protein